MKRLFRVVCAALLVISGAGTAQIANARKSAPVPATASAPGESRLVEHAHYTNRAGNVVHSPAHTKDGSIPEGATARCGDGTYSFSQSRRGTCSRHGGVAEWLRN